MSAVDLKPFCGDRFEIREALRAPFRIGQWVYATNGHLAVRVPFDTQPDVTEHPRAPNNISALFARAFEREGEFLVIPPLPPTEPCATCNGKGFQSGGGWYPDEECPHCLGRKTEFKFQRLGDSGYSLHYLHLLAALPQVRIRTDGIGAKNPAALIFDGGEAILMPMREK